MTRVLLVDDHAVVRRGVRDILTEALGKVEFGEACKPSEALEKLQKEAWTWWCSTFLCLGVEASTHSET